VRLRWARVRPSERSTILRSSASTATSAAATPTSRGVPVTTETKRNPRRSRSGYGPAGSVAYGTRQLGPPVASRASIRSSRSCASHAAREPGRRGHTTSHTEAVLHPPPANDTAPPKASTPEPPKRTSYDRRHCPHCCCSTSTSWDGNRTRPDSTLTRPPSSERAAHP